VLREGLAVKELLELLDHEGRCPVEEMATRLGLPVEQVAAKLDELERAGVILGYRAVIDWDKAAVPRVFAFIEVKATPEPKLGFDGVAQHIARFAEVHSVYLMSGAYDLSVVVQGKDFRDIARFVAEDLAPHPQVVSTATHLVMRVYKLDGTLLVGEVGDRRLAVTP
jgi:DNA-binding Lrp family transcriptional regulator